MIGIQGGNALEAAPEGVLSIPGNVVVRITLVHLTNAALGTTNSPVEHLRSDKGLSELGRTFVRQCNERRVFVDLAHIHERAFWDAVEVHDRSQPLVATHAGVKGVRPHWRNLSDEQVKVVADTGGVVGVIFEPSFLRRPGGPSDGASMIVEHLEHVVKVGGEDAAALGSDYDGAIRPCEDVRGADRYPVVVQRMLDRGWSEERIRKVLGANFLASFQRLRP
jgi:membrane dipeptidase